MAQEIMDFVDEFNKTTAALRNSGANLGKIRITLNKDAVASYWTRRIREEMNDESQDCGTYGDIP